MSAGRSFVASLLAVFFGAEVGQIWGQSQRPTAYFGGLKRMGTRTLLRDCISQRLSMNGDEQHLGTRCIVPPSAPFRPNLSSYSEHVVGAF
jgi:hypothetical protein